MKQYLDYLRHIKEHGRYKEDRTGTGTYSVFGYQMRFNLAEGFPMVTTKKLHMKSIIHELIWFLQGTGNIAYLKENGVTIWDEWADVNGDLGPVYGVQWRSWPNADGTTIDQIQQAIDTIKNNPDSRRIMVTAWNPSEVPNQKLPPCHALFQFYVEDLTLEERSNFSNTKEKYRFSDAQWFGSLTVENKKEFHNSFDAEGIPRKRLSCQLYQRSCDSFLGVPFNITSYALLTHMMAHQADMAVGDFVWTGGDCHIYSNHVEQIDLQLTREPMKLPQLKFKRKPESIFDYKYDDFEIVGYDSHPAIKGAVAV